MILCHGRPHQGPSPGQVEADLYMQQIGLPYCVPEQRPPFLTQELYTRKRLLTRISPGADQVDPADAFGLELLKVPGDAFLRDPIKFPEPVYPGFCGIRRRVKGA